MKNSFKSLSITRFHAAELEQINEITAQNLSFSYGETMVFDNLHFHLKPDTKTVIVGVNGSRKSTLLKILCGLLKNYKGSLKINQMELKDAAILILDEPNNNLDADALQWLNHFIQTVPKTVLYISHEEELSKLAQQQIEM